MPPATRRAIQANMPGSLAAYSAFVVDKPNNVLAIRALRRRRSASRMEHLWSQANATGGNRSQMGETPKTAHIGGSATGDGMI
jgi:hypothetical protein